jgi:hypothetical protein
MSSLAVDEVLPAQEFYTRTAQFMREVDRSWGEQRV